MRRGSEAIEFALSLPILLIAGFGIIDFGWYVWQKEALVAAVARGARSGSVVAHDADPRAAAVAATAASLAQQSVPFTPRISATFTTDATGDELIAVDARGDWDGLLELVGAPWTLHAAAAMRMEEQPTP